MTIKYNVPIIISLLVFCLLITQPVLAKKFVVHPLLQSMVLPGSGQISLDKTYGYAMLTGEVMAWSSYFYSTNEQKLKNRASYEYALKFAHVNPGSYSSEYFNNLSKFNTSSFDAGGYNAMVRQTALALPYPYQGNPELQQQYIDEHAIPEDQSWSWDSSQDRRKYSTLRKDILVLKDQAQVITGIIIANHIISTIDMLRLKKQWKNVDATFRYQKQTAMFNVRWKF